MTIATSTSVRQASTTKLRGFGLNKLVEVWMIDESKRLLCIRHPFGIVQFSGKWQAFLGSSVETGQSSWDAAITSVTEAVGTTPQAARLHSLHTRTNEDFTVFTQVFLYHANAQEVESLSKNLNNFTEVRWISLADAGLFEKNRWFWHSIDNRVVEYLQNP